MLLKKNDAQLYTGEAPFFCSRTLALIEYENQIFHPVDFVIYCNGWL